MSISPVPPDTAGFGPVEPALDHLVYAVPDLDAATRAFAAAAGVEPAEGGRHLGRGTRNVLVGFGETSYLEIIGPDPEHPADPGAAVPFGLDALDRPRLVTWAVHPADLEAAAAASAAAGADLGEVWPLSRRTPAGVLLEAVSAVLDALDVRLTVEGGPPGLAALLDTPRGPVVLT